MVETVEQRSVSLKGSLFTLTVLHIHTNDIASIEKELTSVISRNAKFFNNAPIVVNLTTLASLECCFIDFKELKNVIAKQGLVLVGVCGGRPENNQAAVAAGLAVVPNTKEVQSTKPKEAVAPTSNQAPIVTSGSTTLITQPVRNGQQIYARDGDLVVTSSVSPGAELIADGNIHVYGPLRGRALAGVKGNTDARIFCSELDAHLISIAGQYMLSDDMTDVNGKGYLQIYLSNDHLQIEPIGQ